VARTCHGQGRQQDEQRRGSTYGSRLAAAKEARGDDSDRLYAPLW
jgi:hypothetical protein